MAEAVPAVEEVGRSVTRVLHQRLRYTYAAPAHDLRHRLVVVPRETHGGERRLAHRVTVTGADARLVARTDSFGNHVIDVRAPAVRDFIEFEAWAVVRRDDRTDRHGRGHGQALPAHAARDPRLLRSTALTRPHGALVDATLSMRGRGPGSHDPLALAEQACSWVHGMLRYQYGVTTVRTTAAEAVAGGVGVCQDYAHVMVAVCRSLGVASRYVSGHLVGQGGSHAWVEVVVSSSGASPGRATVVAFDPTNDRHAGHNYLTVAVGRDYADVAPTSGAFDGDGPGVLHATKHLAIAESDPELAALTR